MIQNINKCNSCIGKYNYKTAIPCKYCKWNIEYYWGRNESKMIDDNYRYVNQNEDNNIPF